MLRIVLNWRYYVLSAVCVICLLGIFSCPAETEEGFSWFVSLFLSKIIGFGFGYIYFRLFAYWDERNKISELSKFVNEEE